jgi:hypothetical protein
MTGREFALGIVALTTEPKDNATLLANVQAELGNGQISDTTASRLRLLSRLYEGKRPGATISASFVGLWADTCPRFTGWAELAHSADPILRAFSWVFRGCTTTTGAVAPSPVRFGGAPALQVLMLTGMEDAVVPPDMQAHWLHRGLDVDRIRGHGHFWDSSRARHAGSRPGS